MLTRSTALTQRFESAFIYAHRLHAQQLRADGKTPYIAHLMSVAALVLESGGDEDEAIAALLHDAIEDQGGEVVRQAIQAQFGDRVTQIVEGCTEVMRYPDQSWHERKLSYLDQLHAAPISVQRVVIADKLHNARSLLASLHQEGDRAWQRFSVGRSETLWFYQALRDVFQTWQPDEGMNYWIKACGEVVEELEQYAQSS